MIISRRQTIGLAAAIAAPALLRPATARADAKTLKISHQ
jgi:hypothetical protein